MSEDFGYQRDEEQSKLAFLIKKAFMFGAILFSVSCFIYITISAYYFVYHDQNNGVQIIKSPNFPIKITEEDNKGGMTIKDIDKTVYENILGVNKNESLEKGIKVVNIPEEPLAPVVNPARQSFKTDENKISKSALITDNNNEKPGDGKLIVYDSSQNINPSVNEVKKVPEKIIKNTAQTNSKKNASRVQLAAMNSTSNADEYWVRLNNRYPRLFRGLKHFVQEINLGQKGIFYRLQIGDFKDQTEAEEFCIKFIAEAQKSRSDCIVVE